MIGRTVTPDRQTFAPLTSYYGGVSVFTFEGKHFMALGDVADSRCIEVSPAFCQSFLAKFEALDVGFLDGDVEYTLASKTD